MQTRLRKLTEQAEIAGIILAQAGLERLGYAFAEGAMEVEGRRYFVTSLGDDLFPAIGQGAIALQSRADRPEVTTVLQQIDHRETHLAIRAERELQRLLAGDCALPVGVRTTLGDGVLKMRAILFGEQREPVQAVAEGASPEAVAAEVFAHLQVS